MVWALTQDVADSSLGGSEISLILRFNSTIKFGMEFEGNSGVVKDPIVVGKFNKLHGLSVSLWEYLTVSGSFRLRKVPLYGERNVGGCTCFCKVPEPYQHNLKRVLRPVPIGRPNWLLAGTRCTGGGDQPARDARRRTPRPPPGLRQIEQDFRITNHNLQVGQIQHRSPRRTRAHLAITFMAFACVRHLAYRVELQKKQRMSVAAACDALLDRQCSILNHTGAARRYVIPLPGTVEAKLIDDALGLYMPDVPHA